LILLSRKPAFWLTGFGFRRFPDTRLRTGGGPPRRLSRARAAVAEQIERQIAQRDVDKFGEMLRKEPGKYWSSPELLRQHRDAILRCDPRGSPAQPVTQPAAVPNRPAAAPAAPAPAKVAVSDAASRVEIEAMMRTDGGKVVDMPTSRAGSLPIADQSSCSPPRASKVRNRSPSRLASGIGTRK
jgi:hypothetical protein